MVKVIVTTLKDVDSVTQYTGSGKAFVTFKTPYDFKAQT